MGGGRRRSATKLIIENTILPAFKTGDVSGGIKGGADQIARLLVAEAASGSVAATQAAPATAKPVWPLILLGVFGIALLIVCAVTGGAVCRVIMQILFLMAFSSRGGSSGSKSSPFSGGGGSFGGGGSSGSW